MASKEKNYAVKEIGNFADVAGKEFDGMKGRVMLGAALGLTGCEMSINGLPAGKGSGFTHSHKMNEEVYVIVCGSGVFYVDGEEFPVREGSMIRVAPKGSRALKANEPMTYICIQANTGSLKQATMDDGVLLDDKASWM